MEIVRTGSLEVSIDCEPPLIDELSDEELKIVREFESYLEQETSRAQSLWMLFTFKNTSMLIGFIGVLAILHHFHLISRLLGNLTEVFRYYSRCDTIWSILSLGTIQIVYSLIPIPGQSYLVIIMSYFMKSFWKCLLINLVGSLFAAVVAYFFIRAYLRDWLLLKYGDSLILRVFIAETEDSPWEVSIASNVLPVPTSLKNTFLPLTTMSFSVYMFPKLFFYPLFLGQFCLIGLEITRIEDFLNGEKIWTGSLLDKAGMVLSVFMILFSLFIGAYLARKAQLRMSEFKRQDRILKALTKFQEKLELDGIEKVHIESTISLIRRMFNV